MMKKLTSVLLLHFIALTSVFSQAKLVEKIVRKGNEVVIPYEKYILPNGLTLIIHEDHSDPIVHVDVTYHVGSAREELGKSGFAHFFEHMMFYGSEHVKEDEHSKIITKAGGILNGSTDRDRTNYFETLPNNQLETALWLEADRMGFLLDAVTQKKFENQRATVKNEKAQRMDNQPYGFTSEYMDRTLYPKGHPYSWQTIGYVEDLDRVNVDDLKKFFLRWYGPNNATLTVGGDINAKEVVKLVEKYFSSIPRGPEVKDMKLNSVVLDKDRYISYEDNFCQLPMLKIIYPSMAINHEDEPALDCLADILGKGKNSIFYKMLRKNQHALEVFAGNYTSELAGEFTLTAIAFPGKTLAEIDTLINEALKEFEKRGITDEDLERFKTRYKVDLLEEISSVRGKVSRLAEDEIFEHNPNFMSIALKRYQNVTKEDVMRMYNKYIKGKHAVHLSIYPKGQMQVIAAKDNFTLSKENYQPKDNIVYKDLTYKKPKDNFDRSKRPIAGKNPVVIVPPYWTDSLSNGMNIIGTLNTEIPVVYMYFSIKGGHTLSQYEPSKAGVAYLTAKMLNEATENYTTEAISNELEKLGSSIQFNVAEGETSIYINSLSNNIDATLKILEEKLLRPKFNEEDFNRLKKQQVEYIKNQSTKINVLATDVYKKILFGSENIRSIPIIGIKATLESVTLKDVKAFYDKYYSPSITDIVIVGDINQNAMMQKLAILETWNNKKVDFPTLPQAAKIDKTKIYLVNKDKAAQSEIRVGYVAIPYDATGDYYKNMIMNYSFGGAHDSRINLNLREAKGYSYSAYSGFSGSKFPGLFTVLTAVKTNTTDSAMVEIIKEIKNYRDKGITPDELSFTQSAISQSEVLKYEIGLQKIYFMKQIIDYNLDKDFTIKQSEILNKITTDEINNLAKKYLPLEQMSIVIVGDKNVVKPSLMRLGYEIVDLDKEGNLLKVEEKK